MSRHSRQPKSTRPDRKYIISVDLGTTSVRCFLYDEHGHVLSSAASKVFSNSLFPLLCFLVPKLIDSLID